MKTRFSIVENSIMYRKSACTVKKTPFLQGKTEILHRKQDILEENSIMYPKSGCKVK